MFFSSNIRLLRKRKGRTQDEAATALEMKRSTLSGYENGVAEPGIDALVKFSGYFGVAVDTLIKVDLGKLAESELRQLERGYDVFVRGSNLRVLATTVNSDNEDNIEMVPEKAQAGYMSGFADPDYIKVLPAFHLPFLSRQKKYRTFQVRGDSMLPIPEGAWITGEFLQDWGNIRDRQAYIFLTLNDGIVFKIAENLIRINGKLILHSLNPLYESYDIHVNDIREVWKFVHYISEELPAGNSQPDDISRSVTQLQRDVNTIKTQLLKLDL